MTPKQELFVQEYLIDLNATGAARRAGYSERTAHNIGWENVRKPAVAEAIEAEKAARAAETKIDAAWVLDRAKELYDDCIEASDRSNARGTLDLVGKHVKVAAFKEVVSHEGVIMVTTGIDGSPGLEQIESHVVEELEAEVVDDEEAKE